MTDRDTSEDMVPVGMYTETLARLYMRQGHVDKALQIYRHLAAQQPSDSGLKEQIYALEHQLTVANEMGSETDIQALPIPIDWPSSSDGDAYVPLSPAPPSREIAQTRQVIAYLEQWLQIARRRTP